MKKVYESPVMEIVQFVAQENLAAGENSDNSGVWPDSWDKVSG